MLQQSESEERHLALRWRDFHASFQASLSDVRHDRLYHDVTLSCGGRVLHAHRLVLAACSPHMRQLFESTPQLPHTVVCLPTVDPDIMQTLLDFIYTGEAHVRQSWLGALLQLADTFRVRGLCGDAPPDSPESVAISSCEPLATACVPAAKRARAPSADDQTQADSATSADLLAHCQTADTTEVVVEIEQSQCESEARMSDLLSANSLMAASTSPARAVCHVDEQAARAVARAIVDASETAAVSVKQEQSGLRPARRVQATAAGSSKRRSSVWDYYNSLDGQLECKLCGKLFRGSAADANYSSSNYWKHLRRMHNIG